MMPLHTQLSRGPTDAFRPGHSDSDCPQLVRYRRLSLAVLSPFLEARFGFFKANGQSLASRHGFPPRRTPGGRTTLPVNPVGIHAGLPKGHTAFPTIQLRTECKVSDVPFFPA